MSSQTVDHDAPPDRAAALAAIGAGTLDVLVVGGGIVGAAVARDAALRGLRVGLVEQADFASGTSGRSSRLLHGGLRYLAQGRLRLVRQAGREKQVLRRIAGHLHLPLAFVFPAWRGSPWPLWKLRLGVRLYDRLCGPPEDERSTVLDAAGVLRLAPGLVTAGLRGAVRYFDALTNDARLVVDTLRSAVAAGAVVVNGCRLEWAERAGDGWRCGLRDTETDAALTARARCVVNAAGPWADRIPHSGLRLRLTKGVHLVVDRSRLPLAEAVVMTEGRRILFAIPWAQRVILGTTDTDWPGPPGDPGVDARDRDEVLGVVNRCFPDAGLGAADVISCWAGLRPLIADRRGGPSDISRAHRILCPEPGWIDVAGGKLTTCRLMAREAVDLLARRLGTGHTPCRTADQPVPDDPDIPFLVGLEPPAVHEQVVRQAVRREWALHLDDVMLRRAGWHHYCRDRLDIAARVAGWMARECGWSQARQAAEMDRYRRVFSPVE